MKSIITFLILVSILDISVSAQTKKKNVWMALSNVDWEKRYSEIYEMEIGFPKFSNEVKALEGKEVEVKGYILPVETEDESVVLSSLPYSSCFFCGGAGIETVMSVYLKEKEDYDLNQITFKGKLKLNNTEDGLIYQLMEAEEVE